MPGFDPRRTPEERREVVGEFLKARQCCLDEGFSRNLRTTFPAVDQYIDTPLSDFIRECQLRAVVTSTQVELQFSKLTQITDTHAKRLSLAGVCSRQVNHEYKGQVDRWRRNTLLACEQQPSNRCRPAWVHTLRRGASLRAFDLFKSDIAQELADSGAFTDIPDGREGSKIRLRQIVATSVERWPELDDASRKEYRETAEANRAVAQILPSPMQVASMCCPEDEEEAAGPLSMSSLLGEFPWKPSIVDQHQKEKGFQTVVKRFQKAHAWYSPPVEGFPAKIVADQACRGGPDGCCHMLYDGKGKLKCAALSLFTYIKLALEAEAARRSNSGDPLVIMRFTANGLAPRYYLVAPTHAGQTSNFEAELFEMVPETQLPEASDTFPAVNFSFVADTTVNCKPWPKIIRELVLVRELLRYAVEWNISILTSCASTPNMRLVDKATPVVLEDLLQADRRRKEAERLRREAEKAKHLTDVMLGLAAPPIATPTKARASSKASGLGKEKARDHPLAMTRMVQTRHRAMTRARMAQARRLGVAKEERVRVTLPQMSPRVSQIPRRSIGWTYCGR